MNAIPSLLETGSWAMRPSYGRWISGYERIYMVFRDGRVVNRHGRVMTPKIDRYGYVTVRLNKDGRQAWKKVHRLVCEAWHGTPPSHSHHAAHIDGNKLNNAPENLTWATPAENERHKIGHGCRLGAENLVHSGMPGASNPNAKLNDEQVAAMRRALATGRSTRDVAREFGLSQSRVVRIKNGESYTVSALRAPVAIAGGRHV